MCVRPTVFCLIAVQTNTCKTLEREPHPDPYYCKPLEREHNYFSAPPASRERAHSEPPSQAFCGFGTTPTHLEYPISAKTGETLERELQRDLSPGTPETRTNRSGSRSSVLPFSREKHASRSSALLPRCMDGHQKDTKTNTPRAVDLNNRAHARRLHARSPLETCSMWLTLERFTHEKL